MKPQGNEHNVLEDESQPMSLAASPTDLFAALGDDNCCRVLHFLQIDDIASVGCVNKHWSKILKKEGLWRYLVQRDYPDKPGSTDLRVCHKGWAAIYRARHSLATVKHARWVRQKGRPGTFKCTPREGHTLVAWGPQQVGLCFGGFSQTPDKQYVIHDDVHMLIPGLPGRSPRWQPVQTVGRAPSPCYGHTMVACGPDAIYALVFGGMTDSGYFGETNTVAVLTQPRHAAQLPGAPELPAGIPADATEPLVWVPIATQGLAAVADRGYHAAAASEDGMHVYIFGGISRRQSRNDVAVLDVATWTWRVMETRGDPPPPRFGASAVVHNNHLFVVGGGWGYDLLRSGGDHDDVYCLDLTTNTWHRPAGGRDCPYSSCVGRCHAAALVGSKLVFFGGGLEMSNEICWLDLVTQEWGAPNVVGPRPQGRLSATLTVLGDRVFMFGGWMPGCHELGDLHEICCFESHDAALEWEHAGSHKWLVEQVESHHDCDLPTCPCHKLLRRRAQANDELAAETDLAPATGSLYRLGSSNTRQEGPGLTHPSSSGSSSKLTEEERQAAGAGGVDAVLAPAVGGMMYRSGSSHAASPGPSLRAGGLYRGGSSTSAAGHVLAPVNTVVTPGGALYRSGSRAPPAVAVRSLAHAAQEIGLVGSGGFAETRGMVGRSADAQDVGGGREDVGDASAHDEDIQRDDTHAPPVAAAPPAAVAATVDPLSPFQQQHHIGGGGAGGAPLHPPLPRAVVDGARRASLPTGASVWLRKANQAEEELAQRLLDSLKPSDSELQEEMEMNGPAPLRPLWNARSTSAMPTRPALWSTWSTSQGATAGTPQSQSLGSAPSSTATTFTPPHPTPLAQPSAAIDSSETSVFAGGAGEVGPAVELVAKAVARLRVVPEQREPCGDDAVDDQYTSNQYTSNQYTSDSAEQLYVDEAGNVFVQRSDASAALMRLASVAHRENNSAPEMERIPGVMSDVTLSPQAGVAARRMLRQRTVSLPTGLVVEGVPALRAEGLPHRTVSEEGPSRGLEELLSSVFLQQGSEVGSGGVQPAPPVGGMLWRSATVAGHGSPPS